MYRNDLIKAKKAIRNLSVDDICTGAKLSPMTVQKILNGEINIELKSLEAVAKFLEISADDLFGKKELEKAI